MKTTAGQYIQKGSPRFAILRNKLGEAGFTLVELLIVIAILGILGAGVLIAIDPVDKVNSANDSRVQSDFGSIASAGEAYAATHNGTYTANITELRTYGELKSIPVPPAGYGPAYAYTPLPPGCTATAAPFCLSFTMTQTLKSKKYTGALTPVHKYESTTGKTCQVATTTTACP